MVSKSLFLEPDLENFTEIVEYTFSLIGFRQFFFFSQVFPIPDLLDKFQFLSSDINAIMHVYIELAKLGKNEINVNT